MKQKSLSTLGYIMEQLNLPTVYMALSVHVDASLVSKWKLCFGKRWCVKLPMTPLQNMHRSFIMKYTSVRYCKNVQIFFPIIHTSSCILYRKKDNIPIPSINCWCKKNCWMVQMDKHGLRLSEELSMVEAAASTLFQCIHHRGENGNISLDFC